MKPYGLVLAGGGGKGAYQIGAWKAMREIGVTFNAVAGVSIGSINGALIVQDDFKKAEEMWNSISVDKGITFADSLPDKDNFLSKKNWGVLVKEFIKNRGFDASPATDFFSSYIDEKIIREKNIPFGVVTVQMTQGVNPLEIFLENMPQGQLVDYLLASSNVPLATNIGPEGEKFLDGGVYDNNPIKFLRKNGYNRLIVVDISSIKGVSHSLDLENAEFVYIRPNDIEDLGPSFDFDSNTIEMRKEMGYLDTKKAFSYLLGKIFYFLPETFHEMIKHYGADGVAELEEFANHLGVPRLKVYEEFEFISATKEAYKKAKSELDDNDKPDDKSKDEENPDFEKEQEPEKERGSLYSTIIKRFTHKKSFSDFKEAIAILETNII